MSKLTFDNISQSNTINSIVNNQKKINSSLLEKKHWLSEDFLKEYNKRKGSFTTNEEELFKEFTEWHKIEGYKLFDRKKNLLKINHIKRISNYLNVHPWMTIYDQKRIQLIKEDIKTKFLRTLIFNSCVLFPISITLLYRKIGIKSKKHLNKAIIFRTMSFLAIFLLFQDIVYKKIYYISSLNKEFRQKQIFKKYFIDYLNENTKI